MKIPPHDLHSRQVRCACDRGCDLEEACSECARGLWGKHIFCPSYQKFTPKPGPGTILTRKLKALGFVHSPRCSCADMAAKMDRWGADVCRHRMDEILAAMREGALDVATNPKRLPFVRWIARRLVLKSCKESEEQA